MYLGCPTAQWMNAFKYNISLKNEFLLEMCPQKQLHIICIIFN